ncbi:MAG: GDP-L-fucose synthase [Pseudomonadota bacterium]
MNKQDKIYVAGHRGLIGSAIVRNLRARGFENIVYRSHKQMDLANQDAVRRFFEREKPDYVFLAAAKVGGIQANYSYPADFIYINTMIQNNVIHEAYRSGTKRLLFLGSSCIYPKMAKQPLRENYLLTAPLEPTNRAYALAKIAGIETCWSYNLQYGTQFIGAMPTNLFGPGDNYDLEKSHVIPALLSKFHAGKVKNLKEVEVWGTGKPRREFLYSEDAADACVHLMNLSNRKIKPLLGSDEHASGEFSPPLVNVGSGTDVTIKELAKTIAQVVGYQGKIVFNTNRPDGTPQKRLDVNKLKDLGWSYKISLKEGLQDVYERDIKQIHGNVQ